VILLVGIDRDGVGREMRRHGEEVTTVCAAGTIELKRRETIGCQDAEVQI
jgi:hypothetical protein